MVPKTSNKRRFLTATHTNANTSLKAQASDLSLSNEQPQTNLHQRQYEHQHHALIKAIAPISLLGGTAAVYASVLNHPSSTVTPLSIIYMLLLAIQYSVQPRFSKKYIAPTTSKQSVALVEEIVKTSMAAILYFSKPQRSSVQTWTLSSSVAAAAIPAVLYAIQGVLQYMSHQHLDPITFNGLSQTKTLSAALCCYVILGTPQSPLQMIALVLLLCSSILFQDNSFRQMKATTATSTTTNDSFIKGIVPCLGATLLSGLAGALSQKGLQQLAGGIGRDAFLYTMEISFYSALTLLVSMTFSRTKTTSATTTTTSSWFHGWTWKTWIPILIKAYGGVLTALVHKYAGTVAKGFAVMFGLVLSQLISTIMMNDEQQDPKRQDITLSQFMGTMLVMLSGWMHFTNPPQ